MVETKKRKFCEGTGLIEIKEEIFAGLSG